MELDKLLNLITASMEETTENRLRFARSESLDNAAYLTLVSTVLRLTGAIIVEKINHG